MADLGMQDAHLSLPNNIAADVKIEDGVIAITFSGAAFKTGGTVDLTPNGKADGDNLRVTWSCSSVDAPQKLLPADCRQ